MRPRTRDEPLTGASHGTEAAKFPTIIWSHFENLIDILCSSAAAAAAGRTRTLPRDQLLAHCIHITSLAAPLSSLQMSSSSSSFPTFKIVYIAVSVTIKTLKLLHFRARFFSHNVV